MAEKYTNLARSTLASGISAVATSLTVQTGDGNNLFPSLAVGDWFRCLLYKKSTGETEFIRVTARSADVFTITRGDQKVGNITPIVSYAFDAGDLIECRPTAEYFDSLSVADTEIQKDAYNYEADTGSVNNYAVTLSPIPASLTNGLPVRFKPANTNTAASFLNVNGLGAKSITKHNGIALIASDLIQNRIYHVIYRSTSDTWELQTPVFVPPASVRPQGAGSTLDADTLDTYHASQLLNRTNHTGLDDLESDVSGILTTELGGTGGTSYLNGAILTGGKLSSITSVVVGATKLTLETPTAHQLTNGMKIVVFGPVVGSGDLVTDLPGKYVANVVDTTHVNIQVTTTGVYTSGANLFGPFVGVSSAAKGELLLGQGASITPAYLSAQGTADTHALISKGAGADPEFSRVAVPSDFFKGSIAISSTPAVYTLDTGLGTNDFSWGVNGSNVGGGNYNLLGKTVSYGIQSIVSGAGGSAPIILGTPATGHINFALTASTPHTFYIWARKNY